MAQVSKNHDPETFTEASENLDWDAAMDEEYHSLMENDTWDLVPLRKGRKLVRCKWVHRSKYASDGSVERLKAMLVSLGSYNTLFHILAFIYYLHFSLFINY